MRLNNDATAGKHTFAKVNKDEIRLPRLSAVGVICYQLPNFTEIKYSPNFLSCRNKIHF
jgi:hypothetical protein